MNLSTATSWASAHKALFLILAGLALFAGGFGSAIAFRPAKVVTKTEIQTKVVTEVQWKERIVTVKAEDKQDHRKTHTVVDAVKRPDGTVETKTTTDVADDRDDALTIRKDDEKQKVVTQVVTQTVFKEKLVFSQPNWAAWAGVGLSIPVFLGAPDQGVPGLRGFVVQAGVDRRLAGPLWGGIWGNTQGVFGLGLRLTW